MYEYCVLPDDDGPIPLCAADVSAVSVCQESWAGKGNTPREPSHLDHRERRLPIRGDGKVLQTLVGPPAQQRVWEDALDLVAGGVEVAGEVLDEAAGHVPDLDLHGGIEEERAREWLPLSAEPVLTTLA